MKLRKIILVGLTAILFWQINSFCQSNAPEMNPEIADMFSEIFSNAPPPPKGFATPLDYLKSFTNAADIVKAYRSGKISREEAELAGEMDKVAPSDKNPMDTYGKVVDQDGQPVVGAKVRGFLDFEEQDNDEEHDTNTDSQGQFNFLGLHGQGMAFVPEKDGYEFNQRFAYNRPNNYLPDPNNPFIVHMWKLRGAEPMTHYDVESSIPRDGTAINFNLLTVRKDVSGGLAAQMLRDPLEIAPKDLRKPFNWSVTLSITNGGLLEYTNQLYPYEAPSEGYQKSITLSFTTNMVGWQSWTKRDYYFNDNAGQIYGRMTVEVHAGAPTPEAFFEINAFANPNNSRNLEFDPLKQIR